MAVSPVARRLFEFTRAANQTTSFHVQALAEVLRSSKTAIRQAMEELRELGLWSVSEDE
jgi:biotin operon repressor